MEISRLLPKELREIYEFAASYAHRHRTGAFRQLMADTATEIVDYGTIETGRLNVIKKSIESAKRRIRGEKGR